MDCYTLRVGARRGGHERCWDKALSAALLSDASRGAVRPLPPQREDAHWRGELSKIHGGWQLQGCARFILQRECSRCLRPFWWSLQVAVEREFLSRGDDDGALLSEEGEVDLIDLLREEVWLSWQQFVQCGAGCQGVENSLSDAKVPNIKADVDNPFAVLSQLKFKE